MATGQSFDEIEAAILAALPTLKHPLVPRNVPWFALMQVQRELAVVFF
ncbi:hypothetical protein ACRCF9_22875 [Pseudomonas canadensis]|nr:hypothetical protein [Pseudomonas sp. C 49-2]